jgi:uncharacterized protein
MPYDAPPNLADLTLAEIAELARARKLPPVESWNPTKSGDSEMRIAADGRWFHQGGEISRPAMIRAFSSLLRREANGSYWLVTPHEKLRITIDDAPFIAVELRPEGSGQNARLAFRVNTDDLVIAGPENRIETRLYDGADVPYLLVRNGLWARASRALYYEMAELALANNSNPPGLWSNGVFFPMAVAA